MRLEDDLHTLEDEVSLVERQVEDEEAVAMAEYQKTKNQWQESLVNVLADVEQAREVECSASDWCCSTRLFIHSEEEQMRCEEEARIQALTQRVVDEGRHVAEQVCRMHKASAVHQAAAEAKKRATLEWLENFCSEQADLAAACEECAAACQHEAAAEALGLHRDLEEGAAKLAATTLATTERAEHTRMEVQRQMSQREEHLAVVKKEICNDLFEKAGALERLRLNAQIQEHAARSMGEAACKAEELSTEAASEAKESKRSVMFLEQHTEREATSLEDQTITLVSRLSCKLEQLDALHGRQVCEARLEEGAL